MIDGTTGQVEATIATGDATFPRAIAVDASTHTVYVANYVGETVSVIDGTTNQVTATVEVSDPIGVTVDPSSHAAYVSSYFDNQIVVIDGTTHQVTGSFGVGIHPYGAAVDPSTHTLYVANRVDNTVSVVDTTTNRGLATLAVGESPIAVGVDSATHTAYAANNDGSSVSVIAAGNAPAVSAVSPTSGRTTGGTSVTVTGTDLTGATAVTFGTTAATSFTVDSPTQITAVAPAQGAGAVDVTVTTRFGTSPTSAADRFTVMATPTLDTAGSAGTTAGGTISDAGVLTGGSSPSGTVTFNLFGPTDPTCGGTPLTTATVAVDGGTADSGPVTVTTAGTYRWTSAYSGDVLNEPASRGCGDSTTVTAAALDHLVVTPGSASVTAGRAQAYTVEGFDAYDNSRGDVTGDATFTVAGGTCVDAVCTPSTAVGSYPVTATVGAVSGSATLAVTPAVVVRIGLGLTSATVAAGRSRTYVVTAFDRFGNTRDVTAAATFSATGAVSCAHAVCSSTTAGVATVTASYKGNQASSQLTVVPAALASIGVGPAATIEAGGSTTFVVNGYDRYGNLRGAVTDGATLSASGAGSCVAAVCGSTVAGGFTVTARYYAFQATAPVVVTPAAFDHVRVSPRAAVVAVGGSITYVVTAFDLYDNVRGVVTDGSEFTAATGASCNGATCTAAKPGRYAITAAYDGVTTSVTLRVVRDASGGRAVD